MKNSFFLVIPKQQSNPKRLIEYEAKAIQYWISELPAGNPGLATRLLHDFIVEANTIQMPCELRLEMLERLIPSASAIEDNLRFRLIKSGFPKEENEHKILKVLVSIQKEFAIGYWAVVKELTQKTFGWLQGKNATTALQRCIKQLGGIIVSHFIMGLAVPDWVWIDLHSLYRLSVKLNINNKAVAVDPYQAHQKSSSEQSYKQILMFGLTEPTGLMQKEIPQIYDYIETIIPLVSLQNKPIADQPFQCIIQTDEDKPPLFLANADIDYDQAILYVDFSKLYKTLDQTLKSSNLTEGRFSSMQLSQRFDQPAAELLSYLMQRWSGIELQSSALFNDRLDRNIAVGLASSHALMDFSSTSVDRADEFLAESKSDSLLSCQFEQRGMLSVGSLISFRKANSTENHRSLGIVNRIIVNKQSPKIHFGVQLLTSSYFAVSHSLPNALKNDDLQKALFYSVPDAVAEKTYIVTDSFLLKEGDVIQMVWKGENLFVMLHDRKNIGLGYWQFNCVRTIEKEKQSAAKKGYDFI